MPDELTALLEETLSSGDLRLVEAHLETCESCRTRVAEQAGDTRWWSAASIYLFDDERRSHSLSNDSPELREVATVLSPTDDPRMIGRIGAYEIAGIVGSGGMGIVLKGLDLSLNRYVAIKLLRPSQAASAPSRLRFEREGRAAASVLHENVIAIHGVSQVKGVPYLVMPYVRGESLSARISRAGPLNLNEILRIGYQIAAGLAAAHAQGVIHRDVKPSNILLGDGVERLKLTDFGLARAVDDVGLTRSGTLAGTPEYMSPEQAQGNVVDAASDLFSLGSVLWTMSTGRAPFVADSCYGVIRQIVDCDPASIRCFDSTLPLWWESLVATLMQKRADDRFSSATEVARLMRGCLAHVQDAKIPLPKELARVIRNKRVRRRNTTAIVVLITLIGGVAGGVICNKFGLFSKQQIATSDPKQVNEPLNRQRLRWHDGTDETLQHIRSGLSRIQD